MTRMAATAEAVLTGIDVLELNGFAPLQGRRIGLVTNHTGLTRDGRATIDVLRHAPGVKLTALFGPEHGIRGEYDTKIADGYDSQTGLPVHSLYGDRYAPSPEQLRDIDTLVFDIQDIGCRFYTYISTLGHLLQTASENGKAALGLDRPNPITGERLEGPLPDRDKLSFTAWHPIPVRHGMTVGELALLFRHEMGLCGAVEVMPCAYWRRGDWFDATGLVWTNPSPNMRSLTAAALYPGIGLLEMTNVSVGRGTDRPFEYVGAPFIDPRRFADALHDQGMPGLRFVPRFFTPTGSIHAGQRCGGVEMLVTDRNALDSVRVGFSLAAALHRLYPDAWEGGKFLTLLANRQAFEALMSGQSAVTIAAAWGGELQQFAVRREPFLLYSEQ